MLYWKINKNILNNLVFNKTYIEVFMKKINMAMFLDFFKLTF